MMKKRFLKTAILICSLCTMSMPVCAKNNSDTRLPTRVVSSSGAVNTDMREKEDDSFHYIWNQSDFSLNVRSLNDAGNVNYTNQGKAIVPIGEYFISNWVYERNAFRCKLNIKSEGVGGILYGWWSPDSIGSYPVVNPV